MGTVSDQFNGSVWPWFVIWCSASPHLRHGAGMLMCVRVWTACLCSCECMRATLHPVELAFNLDSKKKKKNNKTSRRSNRTHPLHTHIHTSHSTQARPPSWRTMYWARTRAGKQYNVPQSSRNRVARFDRCGVITIFILFSVLWLAMHFYSLSDSCSPLVCVCGPSIYTVVWELLGINWLSERVCSI